jgi:aminopeptidase N/puromycin-sensitive aminopeptidase
MDLETKSEQNAQLVVSLPNYFESCPASVQVSSRSRLVTAAGSFCSAEKHDEVLGFFNTHEVTAGGQALRIAGEAINSCVQLRNAQEPNLREWLATHN